MDEEELIIPVGQLRALVVGIHDAATPGYVAFDAKGTKFLRAAFQRLDKRKENPQNKKPKPRAKKIHLTKQHAELVRKIARENPKASRDEISIAAGLNATTVRNRKDELWIDDWGVARTLSQIVDIARMEANRHEGDVWTLTDVAQFGISNKYRRNSD